MSATQDRLDQVAGVDADPPPAVAAPAAPAAPPAPEQADPVARLAAADERERVSRDLHDLVLQRLFGLGASLSALSVSTTDERTAERLAACVDDLDQTIDAIRDGILHQGPMATPDELRPCPPAAVVALAQAVAAEHN